jgi:hypothetical protein
MSTLHYFRDATHSFLTNTTPSNSQHHKFYRLLSIPQLLYSFGSTIGTATGCGLDDRLLESSSEFGVLLAADRQSTSSSWYRASLWDPWPDSILFFFFSFDSYFILFPTAFSLTRKRVSSLQCLHSLVRLLTTNNHTLPSHSVSFETVFPFCRLLRLAGTTVEVF